MLEDILEQPRGSRRKIGCDRNPCDMKSLLVWLDNRVDNIAEFARDIEFIEWFATIGTKPAHTIRERFTGDEAENNISESLEYLLVPTKVSYLGWLSISDNDICLSIENWTNKIRDISSWILIVCISIHEDIRMMLEGILNSCLECSSESSVFLKWNDMMNSEFSSNWGGWVCRPIINYLILDNIYSIYLFWEFSECFWKGFFFVFTWNLYDEFHNGKLLIMTYISSVHSFSSRRRIQIR